MRYNNFIVFFFLNPFRFLLWLKKLPLTHVRVEFRYYRFVSIAEVCTNASLVRYIDIQKNYEENWFEREFKILQSFNLV